MAVGQEETNKLPEQSVLDELLQGYFRTHPEEIEAQYRQGKLANDLENPVVREVVRRLVRGSGLSLLIEPDTALAILSTPASVQPEELSDNPDQWPQAAKDALQKAVKIIDITQLPVSNLNCHG